MDAQVIVVGAGICGLSAAWHCQQLGHSVLVLDASGVGAGQSGGDRRIFRISHDETHWVRQARAAREGWERWRAAFDHDLLVDVPLVRSGDAYDQAFLAQGLRWNGCDYRRLTDPPVPDAVGEVLVDDGAAVIDLARTMRTLAGEMRVERSRVESVLGGLVQTDTGTLSAQAVIVCAGAGTQEIATNSRLQLPGRWRRHARVSLACEEAYWPWIDRRQAFGNYGIPVEGGYAVGMHGPDPLVHEVEREAFVEIETTRILERTATWERPMDEVIAVEDCVYLDEHPRFRHDGWHVHDTHHVQWMMGVNLAKMAPLLGEQLAERAHHLVH